MKFYHAIKPAYSDRKRQILRIMKLSALLITLALLQVSARSIAQKDHLERSSTHASLDQVFKDIRQQSGYDFFYDGSLVQQVGPITISVKDATIEETLKALLRKLR